MLLSKSPKKVLKQGFRFLIFCHARETGAYGVKAGGFPRHSRMLYYCSSARMHLFLSLSWVELIPQDLSLSAQAGLVLEEAKCA